jgi:hypothetical protein
MTEQIKVVPDLEMWEVMKRAAEGEPVAYTNRKVRIISYIE